MKKYRHIINIGLFFAQVLPTLYLIYYIIANSGTPDLEIVINFIFILTLTFALFKNKNLFTLLLGLTLVIGNFCGLTAFVEQTKQSFFLNIGSFPLPLYWGQPFYSLLLLIYLMCNSGFFIGIATKEYWSDFLTRTHDLEPVYKVVKPDQDKNSGGQLNKK